MSNSTPKNKSSYTEELKNQHVSQWKDSGFSMSEYSRQAGISTSSLSKWNACNKFKPVTINSVTQDVNKVVVPNWGDENPIKTS